MIKIKLNTVKNILKEYEVPKEHISDFGRVVRAGIITDVYNNAVRIAETELNTSRQAYLNGIKVTPTTIEVVGFLPNAVENGLPTFDMKVGFGNSNKKKFNRKGNWYLTIPLQGEVLQVQQTFMPKDILYTLKGYNKLTKDVAINTLKQIEDRFQNNEVNFSKNVNMVPNFRRVGEKTDPSRFIHPGITARNILERAWQQSTIDDIIDRAIDTLFQQ